MAQSRSAVTLLIAFIDLTRFAAQSRHTDDQAIAAVLDEYYEHVAAGVESAGGTVVKFIGDAVLIVFPESSVDRGVETLLSLKTSIDQLMADRGWECRLTAKVHLGSVVAGDFGARTHKRYDIIGKNVNAAAMLDATGVTLSADVYRSLGGELRSQFREHTPPATYIRLDDPTRFRWTGRS